MISQKAILHNRFDFEIYDTETGETQYAQAENIVLNNMWERLCAGTTYFGYIGVGTGSGTLAPTRTTLFSHLAYKAVSDVETVYDTDDTAHITQKAVFSELEAIGTWTEVGILYGTTTKSNYVTHALITDAEGNPITIPKTNTKIITIYATVFAKMLQSVPGNANVPLVQNNIMRALLNLGFIQQYFCLSALKCIDGKASNLGIIAYKSSAVSWNADAPNKRMYTNLVRVATSEVNQDIRGISLQGSSSNKFATGSCAIPLTGVYDSHAYTNIAIGTGDGSTTEFDFPKDFVLPLSETLKVGGVAKTRGTDYEIHYGPKSDTVWLVNTPDARKEHYIDTETIVIPQPPDAYFDDGAATITSIVFKATQFSNGKTYDIQLSTDGINWVAAGSGTLSNNQVVTLNGFAPVKYKYIKYTGTMREIQYIKIGCTPPSQKQIKFTTPPANGAAITADFSVDYIPKSANFVLDLQAEVIFGEGV